MSKVMGKIVSFKKTTQTERTSDCYQHNLFIDIQSAYLPYHSAEPGSLSWQWPSPHFGWRKYFISRVFFLFILDASPFSDIIGHDVLLHYFQFAYCTHGAVLYPCSRSCLSARTEMVSVNGKHHSPDNLCYHVHLLRTRFKFIILKSNYTDFKMPSCDTPVFW